jgi:hypothetical protein
MKGKLQLYIAAIRTRRTRKTAIDFGPAIIEELGISDASIEQQTFIIPLALETSADVCPIFVGYLVFDK